MKYGYTSPERKEVLDSLLFDITHGIIDFHGGYYLVRYISKDGVVRDDVYVGPIDCYANLLRFLQSENAPYDIMSDDDYMTIRGVEGLGNTVLLPNMLEQYSTGTLHKVSCSIVGYEEKIHCPNYGEPIVYPDNTPTYKGKINILVMNALGFDDAVELASLYLNNAYDSEVVKSISCNGRQYEAHSRYEFSFNSVEVIENITLYPTIDLYRLPEIFPYNPRVE